MSNVENVRQQFGQRVRSLRLEREWSQEKLAEESGLHVTYISGIERGKRNISLDNIARIASALQVSLANLFGE